LVPLPSKHTLPVKAPFKLSASAFGDLREDNLQLIIQVSWPQVNALQFMVQFIVTVIYNNGTTCCGQWSCDTCMGLYKPPVQHFSSWQIAMGSVTMTSVQAFETNIIQLCWSLIDMSSNLTS